MDAIAKLREAQRTDNIIAEIVRLISEKDCVYCFAKLHRPEEQEKLRKADMKLAFYKKRYPDKWERLEKLIMEIMGVA